MVKLPENADLIHLRNYFNENPEANFIGSLSQSKLTKDGFDLLTYNSFGICDQVHLRTDSDGGLTRVQASLRSKGHQAKSSIAEIAAYSKLRVAGPSYFNSLKNLYSIEQHGQEFQNFDMFIPKDQVRKFVLGFGSKVNLLLSGGSNYWKSYSDEY